MNIFQALLCAIVTMFCYSDASYFGTSMLQRPIISAPLVGLIFGQFEVGVIIGGTLELAWLGMMNIGATQPASVEVGGVVATAFTIASGGGTDLALVIGVPVALLASYIQSCISVFCSWFIHKADKYVEAGDIDGVNRIHLYTSFIKIGGLGIVTFVSLLIGAPAVQSVINSIPENIMSGFGAINDLLPAVGFAMLLAVMNNKKYMPFFFIGFLVATYLQVNVMFVALLSCCVAVFLMFNESKQQNTEFTDDFESDFSEEDNLPAESKEHKRLLSKKDLLDVFFRSFCVEASFNYERMQGLGYAFTMSNINKKLYKNKEERSRALRRDTEMFNTAPWLCTLIFGIGCAMEERRAQDPNFDEESLSAVKVGMMGPIAGIGDSIYWGTLRVIAGSIGATMMVQGNPLGILAFILIFNVPHLIIKYYLMFAGYNMGTSILEKAEKGGLIDKIMSASTIVGLSVVGCMVATTVVVNTPLALTFGESVYELQTIFDSILPNLLPLLATLLMFYLMVKKNVKPVTLIFGVAIVAMILRVVGII